MNDLVRRLPSSSLLAVGVAALVASACSMATMRATSIAPPTDDEMAQLWVEPEDLTARDLFWGPGGPEGAPKPQWFIESVGENGIVFDYRGRHRELFRDITPADVVWTCRLLSRNSPTSHGRTPSARRDTLTRYLRASLPNSGLKSMRVWP